MTKFSHLTKGKSKIAKKKKKLFKLPKLGMHKMSVIFGIFAVVLGVGYLVQINGLVTKGYHIKELEQQIADLEEQNSDLELEALSMQSMNSVKGKIDKLGLVAVENVEYLNSTPLAVAR